MVWSWFAFNSGGYAATLMLHGTGFDAGGNPLPVAGIDASWTISNDPISSNGQAFFIAPGNPNWFAGSPPYVANTNTATFQGSGWVSDNASSTFNGAAPYTFSMQFDLSSLVLSTVSISGLWSIADGGTLNVNGNLVASLDQSTSPWGTMHAFSITNTALLHPGLNTISMTVTQSDTVFEAARFEGTVTGTLAVPEPGSLLLLAASVPILFALRTWSRKGRS
jgi:hypothetical protein